MKDSRARTWFCCALPAAALLLAGCGDKGSTTEPVVTGSMHIQMTHVVTDPTGRAALVPAPLVFNDIRYTTPFGNEFSVETLKYYISNVSLQGPDGNVDFGGVHYIDGEVPSTMEMAFSDIPERHYHYLVFTFGLDEATNVTDGLAATAENLNMIWPTVWGGGYHYMKLEGKVRPTGGGLPIGFYTHLGHFRADDPDSVSHHHEFTVQLPIHQTILAGDDLHVEVLMDINGWYRTPNEIDLETHGGSGIMSDTPMQDLMQQNGAHVFGVGEISGGHGEEDPPSD